MSNFKTKVGLMHSQMDMSAYVMPIASVPDRKGNRQVLGYRVMDPKKCFKVFVSMVSESGSAIASKASAEAFCEQYNSKGE